MGAFVTDRLQKTGVDSDYVQRSQLYQVYRGAYAEERNPKTSLGKHKLFEQMKKHLGEGVDEQGLGFRDLKKMKIDGKPIQKREVWLGWKQVT